MLSQVKFHPIYSSGYLEPTVFFLQGLLNSEKLDLALGFFSSSGIRTLALGFTSFLKNGGTVKITINNVLSSRDKAAILEGKRIQKENIQAVIKQSVFRQLDELYANLTSYDEHFFRCLSWLIAHNRIEFIATVPSANISGIAHQKFGIFTDKYDNKVAFSGSANFSETALIHNVETIDCYRSWLSDDEYQRVIYYQNFFKEIWNGEYNCLKSIPITEVQSKIIDYFPTQSIEELENNEIALVENVLNKVSGELKIQLLNLRDEITANYHSPRFPASEAPRAYQIEAKEKWIQSGKIGFFEMATGTGKTYTSLNCALELYREIGELHTLIVVPTLALVDQWQNEVKRFNLGKIIIANSQNSNWLEDVQREINKNRCIATNFCVITTYATFAKPEFQTITSRLKESTLFIADEAHNFGTKRMQECYPQHFKYRIGLSATPARHFDEEGTLAILDFFGSPKQPTFSFCMRQAIEAEFLCEYFYYPKIVYLQEEELQEYRTITKKLLPFFDKDTQKFKDDPLVERLLLQRKQIIHKCMNKLDCLREILTELKGRNPDLKYTIVYVPEGCSKREDKKLIDEYSRVISNEFGLSQHQYTSTTNNRPHILKYFATGKLSVLTAMKCLDEGIDIKRAETAIFCASTSNPRQFIQRRGRILRTHPDKKFAYIYDMVVLPKIERNYFSEDFQLEKSLLLSELRRVYEFSLLAKNKHASIQMLDNAYAELGENVFSLLGGFI